MQLSNAVGITSNRFYLTIQPITGVDIAADTSGSTNLTRSGGSHAGQCYAFTRCVCSVSNA